MVRETRPTLGINLFEFFFQSFFFGMEEESWSLDLTSVIYLTYYLRVPPHPHSILFSLPAYV